MKKLLITFLFTLTVATVSTAQRHQVYTDGFKVQVVLENVQTGNTYSDYYFLYYKNYDKWDEITFYNKNKLEIFLKEALELYDKKLATGESVEIASRGAGSRYRNPVILKRNYGTDKIKITYKGYPGGPAKIMFLTLKQVKDISTNLVPF